MNSAQTKLGPEVGLDPRLLGYICNIPMQHRLWRVAIDTFYRVASEDRSATQLLTGFLRVVAVITSLHGLFARIFFLDTP
jgi:hypothetical protein